MNTDGQRVLEAFQAAEHLYLEWFNNFLTIEKFAEYLAIPEAEALKIVELGRFYNHNKTDKYFPYRTEPVKENGIIYL